MAETRLMPVGVDFGMYGGLVALDGSQVARAVGVPVVKNKIRKFESDEKQRKGVAAKPGTKLAKVDRYKTGKLAGETKPGVMICYDEQTLCIDLKDLKFEAFGRGYEGLFVLIEEPIKFQESGAGRYGHRNSAASYFSAGRCQNAWFNALAYHGIPFAVVPPGTWKAGLGVDRDKDATMAAAIGLYPDLPDNVRESEDLTEALLICHYLKNFGKRYLL